MHHDHKNYHQQHSKGKSFQQMAVLQAANHHQEVFRNFMILKLLNPLIALMFIDLYTGKNKQVLSLAYKQ